MTSIRSIDQAAMESARVRVAFDDGDLLSESQRSQGLDRSWFLVKPELKSVSDLARHLARDFNLAKSCPNGLILYVDGFVLPSFESTRILKDNDVVRVKRKGSVTGFLGKDDEPNLLEDSGITEKQPVLEGGKFLALIEDGNRTIDNTNEPEANGHTSNKDVLDLDTLANERPSSRKRKSSKSLENKREKKIRSKSPEKSPNALVENVENDKHIGYQDDDNGTSSKKKSQKKEKSSKSNGKYNDKSTDKVEDRIKTNAESLTAEVRQDALHDDKVNEISYSHGCEKKTPSRSARRKKAKRIWLRELLRSQKEELKKPEDPGKEKQAEHEGLEKDSRESIPSRKEEMKRPEKSVNKKHAELEDSEKDSESEDDPVPIVIRPGHIRFGPVSEGQVVQQTRVPLENFQWNGAISKKRGQKWGLEKTSPATSNAYKVSRVDSVENRNWSMEISSGSKNDGLKEASIENLAILNGQHLHGPVDFEKLKPLRSTPKKGDVVTYRLVELSSSLCPELTPFRVGKVSWYDSLTDKIMLEPVPGYPVITKEGGDDEDDAILPDSDVSLYREDGTLEIDFQLLHDVRTFNSDDPNPVDVVASSGNRPISSSKEIEKPSNVNSTSRAPRNDIWEELTQALSEKKQMLEKNGWNIGDTSGRSSWSYKAMRSSALGPTIAMLRAGNEL
ncbi:hypothetical protein Scep_021169 [Stephania cephalantha]|uniref:Coilin n=1 Tax=Stephania cephalantha TaxID=152367 RepID=A0AAP0I1A8_9MAGN